MLFFRVIQEEHNKHKIQDCNLGMLILLLKWQKSDLTKFEVAFLWLDSGLFTIILLIIIFYVKSTICLHLEIHMEIPKNGEEIGAMGIATGK